MVSMTVPVCMLCGNKITFSINLFSKQLILVYTVRYQIVLYCQNLYSVIAPSFRSCLSETILFLKAYWPLYFSLHFFFLTFISAVVDWNLMSQTSLLQISAILCIFFLGIDGLTQEVDLVKSNLSCNVFVAQPDSLICCLLHGKPKHLCQQNSKQYRKWNKLLESVNIEVQELSLTVGECYQYVSSEPVPFVKPQRELKFYVCI